MIAETLTWILRASTIAFLVLLTGCSERGNETAFDRLQNLPIPLAVDTTTQLNQAEPIRPLPPVTSASLQTPMVTLGRELFHDTRLSGDGTLTCASCHGIDQGGDDNLQTATGIRGQKGPINTPTVLNSGFNFRQFWDGRAPTLDEQAKGPVEAGIEMGADWDIVVDTLSRDKQLKSRFEKAFGTSDITQNRVVHAIARYEETLTTPSPFDRYLSGDRNAISADARKGYEKFKTYGCSSCHQGINVGGNLYQQFGALQKVDIDSFTVAGATPVIGERDGDVTMVKVPSLRNIELTAPYFHGGKIKDLAIAVKIMGASQIGKVIPDSDIALIVAFLNSLTGDWQQHAELVP
ncbi:MAG: cytochrome c peroxidase [Granulosicoccus sp.]